MKELNRKKLLPLAAAAGAILLLGAALGVLKRPAEGTETGIPLWSITAPEALSYSGGGMEVTLQKGREGGWMLQSDPALPLNQTTADTLAADIAALRAQRRLTGEELTGLPDRSGTPLMIFTLTQGESSETLTVDSRNDVAGIYYLYDGQGEVYTAEISAVDALLKTPQTLYQPQTLTGQSADDVTAMTVNGTGFSRTGEVWTLDEDPDYALDQDAVTKMVRTICELQTKWTITVPEGDAVYGLDASDVEVLLTFADGTALHAEFGAAKPGDETVCYLRASSLPGQVQEISADHRAAFAFTKESLAAPEEETSETAVDDIIAENPVGGADDYADAKN